MSEALVPKDRPYGERKKLVAEMRAGNIPTEPSGGQGAAISPPSPAPRAAAPGVPSEYDVFANRQPSQPQFPDEAGIPPVSTAGVILQTAAESPNPFIRELASRVAQMRR